jgi:hypothetical protein
MAAAFGDFWNPNFKMSWTTEIKVESFYWTLPQIGNHSYPETICELRL